MSQMLKLGDSHTSFPGQEVLKLVIVIFPRHARDEVRMRKIAHQFLDGSPTILSVRFLPKSFVEIRTYEFVHRFFWRRSSNRDVLYWPRLTLGWSLDPGLTRASERLVRYLSSRYSRISHVIIGDSNQESSYAVKILQSSHEAEIVLSPEGIGVFRAKYGGYPWHVLDHRAMKVRLLEGVSLARLKEKEGLGKRGTASFLWSFRRLVDLWLSGDELPSSSLDILSVDVLVSDWPVGVDFGIEYRTHLRSQKERTVDLESKKSKSVRNQTAFFIHQPMVLSPKTWLKAMATLPRGPIMEVIVKAHHDSRGLEELAAALKLCFPGCAIRVVRGGLAEDLVRESSPGVVIGVTSTVLINLALEADRPKIYSIAEGLRKHASDDEQAIVFRETAHQLEALKFLAGQKIKYF